MNRIFRNKDKDKYMNFAKGLYEHGVLNDDSMTKIQYKPKNVDKDKEKDNYEISM